MFGILLVLTSGVAIVCAQDKNWNKRLEELRIRQRPAVAEYQLGSGDLIEVNVFGVDNFRHLLRINSSGEIALPFVGSLAAGGLTPAELEQELKSRLDGKLIRNPQVSVFVKEYRAQAIFVLGAVNQPGQYHITHQISLIDAIAMASGLRSGSGDQILVQRRKGTAGTSANGASTGPETLKINLKELLEGGAPELDIPIQGGDVVQVPEKLQELFYVIGEVNHPGAFALPAGQQFLLTQALAWAGGPMKTAKVGKGVLVRYVGGKRQDTPVNFNDILQGKKADVSIRANDVIFIPGSTAKNLAYGLLGIIPSTASGAVLYGPLR